jgi:hypothetical protein
MENIIKFIKDLNNDYPNKDIIFAPLGSSIEVDNPGMGGFIYKKLIESIPNIKINYYNTQCYYEYSLDIYDKMVSNNYKPNNIVMGMLVDQDFNVILSEIEKIRNKYPDFGGVAVWEYWNAPKNWCQLVSNKLYQ